MSATAAQQVTPFMSDFIAKYGNAVAMSGYFGWFLVGLASVAIVVAVFMLVGPVRRAASEYVRLVESQIGPAPKPEPEIEDKSADNESTQVDAFVD